MTILGIFPRQAKNIIFVWMGAHKVRLNPHKVRLKWTLKWTSSQGGPPSKPDGSRGLARGRLRVGGARWEQRPDEAEGGGGPDWSSSQMGARRVGPDRSRGQMVARRWGQMGEGPEGAVDWRPDRARSGVRQGARWLWDPYLISHPLSGTCTPIWNPIPYLVLYPLSILTQMRYSIWYLISLSCTPSTIQYPSLIGSGRSSISKRRGCQPRGGTNVLYDHLFLKTAWKWRNFGPKGGEHPSHSPRSTTDRGTHRQDWVAWSNINESPKWNSSVLDIFLICT